MTLHCTQELLTTFGLMHITRFDPDELAAELRGFPSNFQNFARTFTPPDDELYAFFDYSTWSRFWTD